MSRHDLTAQERTELAKKVHRFTEDSRVPAWQDSHAPEKTPSAIPDPATTLVPETLRAEITTIMERYPNRRSAAIPSLAAAQRHHGWCSPTAIEQVACVMRVTPAELAAVATFYDMLETQAVGKHTVYVCTNISCSLCGGDDLLEAIKKETQDDPSFHVRGFECLGACDIAPMASINGVYVGPIASEEVPTLIEQIRHGEPPLPEKQLLNRPSVDPAAQDFTQRGSSNE